MDPMSINKQDDVKNEEHDEGGNPDGEKNESSLTRGEAKRRKRKKKRPPDQKSHGGEQASTVAGTSITASQTRTRGKRFLQFGFPLIPNSLWLRFVCWILPILERAGLLNCTWIIHALVAGMNRPLQTSIMTRSIFLSFCKQAQQKKLVESRSTRNPQEVRKCFLEIRFSGRTVLLATHARLDGTFQSFLPATTSREVYEFVGALGTTLLSRRFSSDLITTPTLKFTSAKCLLSVYGAAFTGWLEFYAQALRSKALKSFVTIRLGQYVCKAIILMVREDEVLLKLKFFPTRCRSSSIARSLEGQQRGTRSSSVTRGLEEQPWGTVPPPAVPDERASVDPIQRTDTRPSVSPRTRLQANNVLSDVTRNGRECQRATFGRRAFNCPSSPSALEMNASGGNAATQKGNVLQTHTSGLPPQSRAFLHGQGCAERVVKRKIEVGANPSEIDGTLSDVGNIEAEVGANPSEIDGGLSDVGNIEAEVGANPSEIDGSLSDVGKIEAAGQAPNKHEARMASKDNITYSSNETTLTGGLFKTPTQCEEGLKLTSKRNPPGRVSNNVDGHGEINCEREETQTKSNFPTICEDDLFGNGEDRRVSPARADDEDRRMSPARADDVRASRDQNEAEDQKEAALSLSIQCQEDLQVGAVGGVKAIGDLMSSGRADGENLSSSRKGGVRPRQGKKGTLHLHNQAVLVAQCEEDLQTEHVWQLKDENRRLRLWFLCCACHELPWRLALIPCGHALCTVCYGGQLACPICLKEVHQTSPVRLSN